MQFDSLLNEKERMLSSVLVAQQEQAIEAALTRYLGHPNWEKTDFAVRASMRHYPDGREVFTFDNQELVEFLPLQITTGQDAGKFTVTASRPYRMLIGPKA